MLPDEDIKFVPLKDIAAMKRRGWSVVTGLVTNATRRWAVLMVRAADNPMQERA